MYVRFIFFSIYVTALQERRTWKGRRVRKTVTKGPIGGGEREMNIII